MENIKNYLIQFFGIFYNQYIGYVVLVNVVNLVLYLYLGFLLISLVNYVNFQGYWVNGQDFNFVNCDRNFNSYFVFYFNLNYKFLIGYVNCCCELILMYFWIIVVYIFLIVYNMFDEFYFDYEIYFGGCGGYVFIYYYNDINGVVLGVCFGKFCKY